MAEICNEFYEMCFGLQNTEYVYKYVLAFIKLIRNSKLHVIVSISIL